MNEPRNKTSASNVVAWLVIISIVAFLVWFIINFRIVPSRVISANACVQNLRQIEAAKYQWALETGNTNSETVVTVNDIMPYIKLDKNGNFPECPSGGTYTIGKAGEKPTCSLGTTVTPAHVLP
ncbi:MAG TPA: hypothetical protein VFV23_03450 [Verrucomicrobiae bacterium]|nr:hypothetical protein [Verrucomicrobiae bacterium]